MTTSERTVPTVSRILGDTLVEILFDRDKHATSFAVSAGGRIAIEQTVRTLQGEVLVPYSATNNLISHDCVLLPSVPRNFGTKAQLLADIEAFLHRYVDLSPTFERIAAHYVLLTWLYDAFAEIPYLRLRGDFGTGKTRGLIAIGSLCYKPFFAAGASTVSPIFHTLDCFRGTLVLDEADLRFSDATADLVKVFNNGTVRGLPVLRSVQNRHKEFNPAAFHVFGPKIIAMRGRFADDALESRFLTEETGTRPLRAGIPLHQPDLLQSEALELRNRLLQYRFETRLRTVPNPSRSATSLDARLNQIALPLLSLVDDASVRDEIVTLLARDKARSHADRSHTFDAQVLKAALVALASCRGPGASVQSVADRLNQAPEADRANPVSPRRVGSVLRQAFHIETRKHHGTYLISASDRPRLATIAGRYGIEP